MDLTALSMLHSCWPHNGSHIRSTRMNLYVCCLSVRDDGQSPRLAISYVLPVLRDAGCKGLKACCLPVIQHIASYAGILGSAQQREQELLQPSTMQAARTEALHITRYCRNIAPCYSISYSVDTAGLREAIGSCGSGKQRPRQSLVKTLCVVVAVAVRTFCL